MWESGFERAQEHSAVDRVSQPIGSDSGRPYGFEVEFANGPIFVSMSRFANWIFALRRAAKQECYSLTGIGIAGASR